MQGRKKIVKAALRGWVDGAYIIVQLMGGWFDTQLTLGDIDKIVLCDYPLLLTFKQLAQDLYPKRFWFFCCWNKGVKIIFLCSIISLFSKILEHLFTSVWVVGGEYLPYYVAAQ